MDFSSLIGPAVVAAVISSLVPGLGFLISARTTRAVHAERLAFEAEQFERRVSAEIALAEKKVTLDRALAAWKRRTELAEEVLTDFYKPQCRGVADLPIPGVPAELERCSSCDERIWVALSSPRKPLRKKTQFGDFFPNLSLRPDIDGPVVLLPVEWLVLR
jgi:hypothetical protein